MTADNTSAFHADIAILGAGIGGYETFRTLAKLLKKYRRRERILLIDRNNYFTFTPMLHEAASGSIEPAHAAIPIRELVYGTPHTFLKATVGHIDPATQIITTDRGDIHYRYAVLALGSGVNYFNTPGADVFSHTVRTLEGAMRLRRSLISLLEANRPEIAITIVGGGFSGIEVAAQMLHLKNHDLKKLYPASTLTITVIEAGSAILGGMPTRVQQTLAKRLQAAGVTILVGTPVQRVADNKITIKDGRTTPSDLTIWCAGVGNYADKLLDPAWVQKGRVPVNRFLQHEATATLYAVGDIALFTNPGETAPTPQLGETAHRQGTYAARHIAATLCGEKVPQFFFRSFGLLIPIGEWYGVVITKRFILTGFAAWAIRRLVYLHFIPGVLRKLKITLDWLLHTLGFRYILEIEENKK